VKTTSTHGPSSMTWVVPFERQLLLGCICPCGLRLSLFQGLRLPSFVKPSVVGIHGIHLVADSNHRAGCQTRSIVRRSKVGRRGLEDANACPDRRWTCVEHSQFRVAYGTTMSRDVSTGLVSLNVVETRARLTYERHQLI